MVGGEWYKDYAAVQRRTPAGSGGQAWAAYLKAKNATSEGYERAFKELDIAARQEGVTVNRPVLASNMSQAQYQEVLSQYLANINNEVLKKNVTNALKDVQRQGMAAGVNVGLPTLANLTNANADSFVNNYINTVNQRIYINFANTAIKDLQAQGIANGVNVPIPAVSNTVSQAQAQEIVNKYQSRVNSALLVKSTQDALKSVQSQAKSYGVNVAVPTISAGITEQAANALIDKYVADVNAKLSSATVSESKPASNNQIQTSSKANNALVGSATPTTVVAPSASIARNSDGSLAVSEGLYKQLKAAQTQYKSWWNDYSGIPDQVINSQATDVRINSKGQFEWTPVTAADKAQLEKINAYRTSSGLAPRTTLIHGPEKSDAYNTKWLSTTGSGSRGTGEAGVKIKDASGKTVKSYDYNTANLAKVGSGDIKIAAIKASSKINANATAKTNTAQGVKAVKLTQTEIKAKEVAAHPGQIQLKDGTWINQVQGSQGIKESVKIISAVKSLEEANKLYQQKLAGNYNPVSRKDITVGDIKTVVHGTVTNEVAKAKHDQTIASTKEFKKQLEAFNDVLAGTGLVSIVTQGHRGTGENSVFVGVSAKDKSGKTIKNEDGSIKYEARSKAGKDYLAEQVALNRAYKNLNLAFNVTAGRTAEIVASDLQVFKTVDQVNQDTKKASVNANVSKALAEAHKINPNGSEEYFAGVAESARRNSIGTKAVIEEDLAAWNALVSNVTKPVVNKVYAAAEYRDKIYDKTSISISEKGQFSITKAGKETLDNRVTYNLGKIQKDIVNDSATVQGFNKFVNAELDEIANKPVTYGGKLALTYAAGAGLGAAAGGAKVLAKMGGVKLAGKTGSTLAKKVITKGSAWAVDATLISSLGVGVIAENSAFKANTALLADEDLKNAKINRAANYFEAGKDFAVGGLGFAKGARYGPAVAKGTIKVVTYARDGTPQVMNVAKSDMIRFLRDERATTGYGKKAVEQWDKISKAKSEAKPAFELVEDANGNLVLKEITVTKAAKIQDVIKANKYDQSVQKGRDVINKRSEELSTSKTVSTNSGKMILKTEAKTISKIENDVLEVVDLSTVTKHPQELKIAQFKAKQRVEIAKERMKKHEFKLNEKPKIEIKSKFAGRKNIEPKRKMTTAQQNAAKKKAIKAAKIKDARAKRQVKVTRTAEEAKIEQIKVLKHKAKTKPVMKIDAAVLGLSKLREKQQQELIAYGKLTTLPYAKIKPVQMQAVKPSQSQKPRPAQTTKPTQTQTAKPVPAVSAKPIQAQIAKDAAIIATVVPPVRPRPTPAPHTDPRKPKPNVKGGEGVKPNYKKRPPKDDMPKVLPPFKFRSGAGDGQEYTGRRMFERDIKNVLGSLKSMFG